MFNKLANFIFMSFYSTKGVVTMHINSLRSYDSSIKNPLFKAKLEVSGFSPIDELDMLYIEGLVDGIGQWNDTVRLEFELPEKGDIQYYAGQGERIQPFQSYDQNVNIIFESNNKVKKDSINIYDSYGFNPAKTAAEALESYFSNYLSEDTVKIYEKALKAQERYDRRHHKGRFEK